MNYYKRVMLHGDECRRRSRVKNQVVFNNCKKDA